MNVLDILVMVLYFGGITAMGVYFARRNKSTEEYFLGNRNFPGWAIGLSLVGTSISSLSFLGIPGDSFKTAWLRFLVGVTMPLVVIVAAYVFLPFYRRTKTTSAFEYLEHRFGPTTRLYGAVTFLIAQLVRISMILYLLSLVLHELSDMPLWLCIVLSGVFVSFYTVAGGMEAVVWTDVIQTVILTVGGVAASLLLLFGKTKQTSSAVDLKNPFELMSAIKFGLVFALILFVSKAAQEYLGSGGVFLAAGLAGLTDVDAITLSMANLAHGSLAETTAAIAILIAVVVNTAVKAGMAAVLGAAVLRRYTLPGFGFVLVTGLALIGWMLL